MLLHSETSNQCPPQTVSWNRYAATKPLGATTICSPSCGVVGYATVSDNGTIAIVSTEGLHQNDSATLCALKKPFKHMVYHSTAQDVPSITTDVDRLPRSLQCLDLSPFPMNQLPFEILTYIFELYVADGNDPVLVPVPGQGPFYLAQVCKLWRVIAESNTRLWTSIQFYFPDSHQSREEDVQRVQRVLDLHLKWSGELPMSISFTDHRIYHPVTEDLISLLADRLRTYGRRWKRISLQLSCGYFPLLFTFTPCDLSSLEHLVINGDVFVRKNVSTLRLDLKSAKNLKSFVYSGPGYSVDDSVDVHWDRLAEVSFGFTPRGERSLTCSRHFEHLIQCQRITTCSLGIDRPVWPDLSGGQSITLPFLQTLRVRRISADSDARYPIDPLVLPQLRTLEIDASSLAIRNQRWHDRTFSNLLARSGCTLRHLSIQDVDFPNDELLRCLALAPELTSFRFIPCPRSQDISDVIRMLHSSPTTAVVQPRDLGPVAKGALVPRLREVLLATSVEGYLDLMMETFRSRLGASAHAAGVAVLRRTEVVFFDMSHGGIHADDRINIPGAWLERRLTSFREELTRWVSVNEKGNGREEDGDDSEALVVVDAPYLPKYINIQ